MVDLVLRHLPIRPAEALGRLVRLGSRPRRSSKLCKLGRAEPACPVQDLFDSWDNINRCQRRFYGDSLVEHVLETPQPYPTDRNILLEANEDLDIEFVLRRDFQEDDCEDGNVLRCISSAQFSDITLLAHGGFGSIYTATWQRPGKAELTVALKVFNGNDDVNEALFDELSELSRCRYFYFPHIYGITKVSVPAHAEGTRALVMQYYPDGDLGTLLAEESDTISWKWRLNILRHTCAALARAHNADILHCNLHSGNILVERLRTMVLGRVADFGLSRVFNEMENHGAGSYGIVPYMAPELLRGERHSKATDIYALGMIMWELSAGRSPFSDCAHDIDLMLRICNGERPPVVVDTPDCWVRLMKRCWDQDPHRRPTAKEVYRELGTWIRFHRNYNVKAIIQFEEAEEQRRQRSALLLSTGRHPQAAKVSKWVPSTGMISEHYELISDDDWEEALANMT